MKKHSYCVLIAILLLLTLTSCGDPSERVLAKDKGDFSYMGFESGYDFYFKPLVSELEHEGKTINYNGTLQSYYFTDFIFGTAEFDYYDKEQKKRICYFALLKVDYDGQNLEILSVTNVKENIPLHYASLNFLCVETAENTFEIRDYKNSQNPKTYFISSTKILLAENNSLYYEKYSESGTKALMLATIENDSLSTKEILNDIAVSSKICFFENAIEISNKLEDIDIQYYSYDGILLEKNPEELINREHLLPTDNKGYPATRSSFSRDAMSILGNYTFVDDFFYGTMWDSENPKMIFETNDYIYIYTEIDGFSTSGSFMHRFNRKNKIIEYLGNCFLEKELPAIRVPSVNE